MGSPAGREGRGGEEGYGCQVDLISSINLIATMSFFLCASSIYLPSIFHAYRGADLISWHRLTFLVPLQFCQ
jgi:hypothetical protein